MASSTPEDGLILKSKRVPVKIERYEPEESSIRKRPAKGETLETASSGASQRKIARRNNSESEDRPRGARRENSEARKNNLKSASKASTVSASSASSGNGANGTQTSVHAPTVAIPTKPKMTFEEELKLVNELVDDPAKRIDFVRDLKEHCDRALEPFRPKRVRHSKTKAQHINDLKNGRGDIYSAESILCGFDLSKLFNMETFNKLPAYHQFLLANMLPECDRITLPNGVVMPKEDAFSNSILQQRLAQYTQRLADGNLSYEFRGRLDRELQKAKKMVDPFKAKYFEPFAKEPEVMSDEKLADQTAELVRTITKQHELCSIMAKHRVPILPRAEGEVDPPPDLPLPPSLPQPAQSTPSIGPPQVQVSRPRRPLPHQIAVPLSKIVHSTTGGRPVSRVTYSRSKSRIVPVPSTTTTMMSSTKEMVSQSKIIKTIPATTNITSVSSVPKLYKVYDEKTGRSRILKIEDFEMSRASSSNQHDNKSRDGFIQVHNQRRTPQNIIKSVKAQIIPTISTTGAVQHIPYSSVATMLPHVKKTRFIMTGSFLDDCRTLLEERFLGEINLPQPVVAMQKNFWDKYLQSLQYAFGVVRIFLKHHDAGIDVPRLWLLADILLPTVNKMIDACQRSIEPIQNRQENDRQILRLMFSPEFHFKKHFPDAVGELIDKIDDVIIDDEDSFVSNDAIVASTFPTLVGIFKTRFSSLNEFCEKKIMPLFKTNGEMVPRDHYQFWCSFKDSVHLVHEAIKTFKTSSSSDQNRTLLSQEYNNSLEKIEFFGAYSNLSGSDVIVQDSGHSDLNSLVTTKGFERLIQYAEALKQPSHLQPLINDEEGEGNYDEEDNEEEIFDDDDDEEIEGEDEEDDEIDGEEDEEDDDEEEDSNDEENDDEEDEEEECELDEAEALCQLVENGVLDQAQALDEESQEGVQYEQYQPIGEHQLSENIDFTDCDSGFVASEAYFEPPEDYCEEFEVEHIFGDDPANEKITFQEIPLILSQNELERGIPMSYVFDYDGSDSDSEEEDSEEEEDDDEEEEDEQDEEDETEAEILIGGVPYSFPIEFLNILDQHNQPVSMSFDIETIEDDEELSDEDGDEEDDDDDEDGELVDEDVENEEEEYVDNEENQVLEQNSFQEFGYQQVQINGEIYQIVDANFMDFPQVQNHYEVAVGDDDEVDGDVESDEVEDENIEEQEESKEFMDRNDQLQVFEVLKYVLEEVEARTSSPHQ